MIDSIETILSANKQLQQLLLQENINIKIVADALIKVISNVLSNTTSIVARDIYSKKSRQYKLQILSKSGKEPIKTIIDIETYRKSEAWCVQEIFPIIEHKIVDKKWHLIILVQCSSTLQRILCNQLLKSLSIVCEGLIPRSIDNKINKHFLSLLQDVSLFPDASDEDVAYSLLKEVISITPDWKCAKFWRTARTHEGLEKIAELNNPKIAVAREILKDWNCKARYSLWRRSPSRQKIPRLPRLVAVYLEDDRNTHQILKNIFRFYGGEAKRVISCDFSNQKKTNIKIIWPYKYGFRSEEDQCLIEKSIKQLAQTYSLKRDECLFFITSETGFPISTEDPFLSKNPCIHLDANVPGPFQIITSIHWHSSDNLLIDKLIYFEKVIEKTIYGFNLTSLIRYYLWLVDQFLNKLRASKSFKNLQGVLTKELSTLFGARGWAIVDLATGKIELTSKSLDFINRKVVDIKWLTLGSLINEPNTNDNMSPWLIDCRDKLLKEVEKELSMRIEKGELPKKAILKPEVYKSIGYVALKIPCEKGTRILFVFKGHCWKLRAIEGMLFQLLRDGIAEALSRTGETTSTTQVESGFIEELVRSEATLLQFVGPADTFAEELLRYAEEKVGFSGALFCAVDLTARVFLPIATIRPGKKLPSSGILKISPDSLAGQAILYADPMWGEREGDKIKIKSSRKAGTSTWAKYQSWLDGKFFVAIPLTWGTDKEVQAVIIMSWEQDHKISTEQFLEIAHIGISWYDGNAAGKLWTGWQSVQKNVDQIRNTPSPSLFETFGIELQNQTQLNILPADLRAVFSENFRQQMRELLKELSDIIGLHSATVRVYRQDYKTGKESLILLSASRNWKSEEIPLDSNIGVNCYCFNESTKRGSTTPFIISVPDVTHIETVHDIYPNLSYKPDRAETRSELSISLTGNIKKQQQTFGIINFESKSFTPLWFERPLLIGVASIIGTEILNNILNIDRMLQGATKQAMTFANWQQHDTIRAGQEILNLVESSKKKLVLENHEKCQWLDKLKYIGARLQTGQEVILQDNIGNLDRHSTIDLHKVTNASIRSILELIHNKNWEIDLFSSIQRINIISCLVKSHPFIQELIFWLLREQVNTLQILSKENNMNYQMRCFLHKSTVSNNISLSISSSAPPILPSIAEKLFWEKIDAERPGKGSTGLGLAMLGVMFRACNIYPHAYENSKTAPWINKFPECNGGWIELIFKEKL